MTLQPHILLIDDDKKLGDLLKDYFLTFNIKLSNILDPIDALDVLKKLNPDLIILDVMLPKINGFEVCKMLREQSFIPIIMLSARGEITDRLTGLSLGADDYLSKPFEPRELVVRVENILKRLQNTEHNDERVLMFNRLKINTTNFRVYIDEEEIKLTNKEYDLLLLMCETPGKIYTRNDIKLALFPLEKKGISRSIDVLVSRLRNKLKPVNYLKTIWGLGYQFSMSSMNE